MSSAGQRQQETVKKSVIPGIPGQPVAQETLFSAHPTHTQQVKDGGQEGGAPGWKGTGGFCLLSAGLGREVVLAVNSLNLVIQEHPK